MWKYCDETQEVLKELSLRIDTTIKEITEFGGLITSPALEREYCRAIGYMDALKEVKAIIETIEVKEDEST